MIVSTDLDRSPLSNYYQEKRAGILHQLEIERDTLLLFTAFASGTFCLPAIGARLTMEMTHFGTVVAVCPERLRSFKES
jgi:hypothetical protein